MDSLELERREVLEAVTGALTAPECDADRAAACLSLLRHLERRDRRFRQSGPLAPPLPVLDRFQSVQG